MTFRQSIMRAVYPLLIGMQKLFGKGGIAENKQKLKPASSFYELTARTVNGDEISFEAFKGKKVLVVNTASDCGYTPQYKELQELYKTSSERLVILAFPANDFKEQEKGNDREIEQFCTINFGVTFPLMRKSSVVKGAQQNFVFKWLTDKEMNGWNNKEPEWNFSKYLVDEDGVLTHYYPPAVSPLSKEVKQNL